VSEEKNKSTKAEDETQVWAAPPGWRPRGKTQWILELMLGKWRSGVEQGSKIDSLSLYAGLVAVASHHLKFIEEAEGWDNRLSETFEHLGQALLDQRAGVIDPLLKKPEGASKRDSTYLWLARMHVVLALEYFHISGQPYDQAAKGAAAKFPELENLKRGGRRELPSSMLSWRTQFLDGKVPIRGLRRRFKEQYEHVQGWARQDATCWDDPVLERMVLGRGITVRMSWNEPPK
jgi:hypothetical protein